MAVLTYRPPQPKIILYHLIALFQGKMKAAVALTAAAQVLVSGYLSSPSTSSPNSSAATFQSWTLDQLKAKGN
jgi:hypothetical protein